MKSEKNISRRHFMASTAMAMGAVAPAATMAAGSRSTGDEFKFEIQLSDDKWLERLTQEEFFLLRQGGTEPPKSHPYWEYDRKAEGHYHCKACDLPLYASYHKVVLDKGWVFFLHSHPLSVLTSIDRPNYGQVSESGESLSTMAANAEKNVDAMVKEELTEELIRALDIFAGVEAVCRRCGSHLGHVVSIDNQVLHCVNGAGLDFKEGLA